MKSKSPQRETRPRQPAGLAGSRAPTPRSEETAPEEYLSACHAAFGRIATFAEHDDEDLIFLSRELDAINEELRALSEAIPPPLDLEQLSELIRAGTEAHRKIHLSAAFYKIGDSGTGGAAALYSGLYISLTGKFLLLQKAHPNYWEPPAPSHEFHMALLDAAKLAQEINALHEDERAKVLELFGRVLSVEIKPVAMPAADLVSTNGVGTPDRAPELWADRDENGGETSIAFLQRVYRPWLDRIHLQDIAVLDQPLYQALQTWRRRHKAPPLLEPFFTRLRRSQAEVDAELKKYKINKPEDAFVRFPNDKAMAQRLYHACRARLAV